MPKCHESMTIFGLRSCTSALAPIPCDPRQIRRQLSKLRMYLLVSFPEWEMCASPMPATPKSTLQYFTADLEMIMAGTPEDVDDELWERVDGVVAFYRARNV